MFDETDTEYGRAIPVFMEKYAEQLAKVFTDNKDFRSRDKITAFCEFYGPQSFSGWHDFKNDTQTVTLFDVEIYKKGFVLPRDFLKYFGHLEIPAVIYEGNFGPQLVEDVKDGKYPVTWEGVVCKGVIKGKKGNDQHGLWMNKIKTKSWMAELRRRFEETPWLFRRQWLDNEKEQ